MCHPAIAAVFSAVGAMQQAQAQQDQANYNAAVASNNAKLAEYQAQDAQQRGDIETQKVSREAAQLKGAQRATLAARGLSLGEGTPLSLLEQTDYFGAVDVATSRTNTGKAVWERRVQAQQFESEAAQQRSVAGNINPLFSGVAAGASTFVAAGGTVSPKWYSFGSKPALSTGTGWGSSFA